MLYQLYLFVRWSQSLWCIKQNSESNQSPSARFVTAVQCPQNLPFHEIHVPWHILITTSNSGKSNYNDDFKAFFLLLIHMAKDLSPSQSLCKSLPKLSDAFQHQGASINSSGQSVCQRNFWCCIISLNPTDLSTKCFLNMIPHFLIVIFLALLLH